MCNKNNRGKQTRQSKPIAHLLHQNTSRSKSRRRNKRAAVVVHNNTNSDVQHCHNRLADDKSLGVFLGIFHLGDNVEEGRGTGIRKDQGG